VNAVIEPEFGLDRQTRKESRGKIAYVKPIRSEDVHKLYPQAPELQPGMHLFALHAADGTPILVTDSREAAIANAMTHELETVSVH
jgi:hypothetical protein